MSDKRHSATIQREDTGIMITRHPSRTSWSRRDMLRGSAAALMGAYGLAPRYGLAADIPMEYDGSKFQMAAPEPNPKRGGVMRYGILNRPPHFDVHQSGTVGNIGTQGCMFDNLIRRDPRDSGKTIVPDLAHSWEIAKDVRPAARLNCRAAHAARQLDAQRVCGGKRPSACMARQLSSP